MPIPTVEDLLAFKLLDSKTKLSDIRKEIKEDWRDSPSRISGAEVVTMEGYTTKRDDYSYEERAFGSYEDMTRARLVCIILLNRRGARLPDWSVTSLSPVFDELWELRGEQATAKDMTELMAGGDRAAALRRKILNARPAPKEKNAEITTRLDRLENLFEKMILNQKQQQQQPKKPSDLLSDVTSEFTDFDR